MRIECLLDRAVLYLNRTMVKAKHKADSYVWTDNDVEMLLRVTRKLTEMLALAM